MSGERLLTIEYVTALPRPSHSSSLSCDDWVASLCPSRSHIAAGCYDGMLRLAGAAGGQTTWQGKAHEGPVKVVAGDQGRLLSGGQDKVVKLWRHEQGSNSLTLVRTLLFACGV